MLGKHTFYGMELKSAACMALVPHKAADKIAITVYFKTFQNEENT
jgi:hypothetical protein